MYGNNDWGYSSEEKGCLWFLVGGVVLFLLTAWIVGGYWVTDEVALERFHELLPHADTIEIIADSGNDNFLVHEIGDVQFELLVTEDGETRRLSGTCTDGIFRELVCRVYDSE